MTLGRTREGLLRTSIDDYASPEMLEIWSPESRIHSERSLWAGIMRWQADHGVPIPDHAIRDYEAVLAKADLVRIDDLEKITKHDLRARLQHFNEQAGHTYAHWGLTSCDITDNVTQILIRESLIHLITQSQRVLSWLTSHIAVSRDLICVARTHNQPAQPTLLGKRFATIADEFLVALGTVQWAAGALGFRGLVGAVGTGQDLVTLLGGPDDLESLNIRLRELLGFRCLYYSTGQIYPRSDDLAWAGAVDQLTAAPTNLARMVRLEAGYGRMWETFEEGQIGSSAMPHKRNPILSERICGLQLVVRGFEAMVRSISGTQWYEGDVADSVVRRVAISGLLKAVDAVLVNTIDLLAGLEVSPEGYRQDYYANSFNARSGEILAKAVLAGVDRDRAYSVLQKAKSAGEIHELDPQFPLSLDQILEIVRFPPDLRAAEIQIDRVLNLARQAVTQHALRES